MFTAKEAHKAAELYTSPEKILETIEKHIKAVSSHGAYELVHDCDITNRETIMKIIMKLREAGYTANYLLSGRFLIHW